MAYLIVCCKLVPSLNPRVARVGLYENGAESAVVNELFSHERNASFSAIESFASAINIKRRDVGAFAINIPVPSNCSVWPYTSNAQSSPTDEAVPNGSSPASATSMSCDEGDVLPPIDVPTEINCLASTGVAETRDRNNVLALAVFSSG